MERTIKGFTRMDGFPKTLTLIENEDGTFKTKCGTPVEVIPYLNTLLKVRTEKGRYLVVSGRWSN